MAWIEIHQNLTRHHKILAMSSELKAPPVQVIGHMVSFWLWAVDNAPDGNLTPLMRSVLAFGAEWTGDPDEFVEAAIKVGFFDNQDGDLRIHDWEDYTGKLINARRHTANQKRLHRDFYNNRALVKAIKERDADICRYCGIKVNWRDRRGPEGATYDFIDPKKPASFTNIVIACRGCNSGKGARTPEQSGFTLLTPVTPISTDNDQIMTKTSGHYLDNSTVPNSTVPNQDIKKKIWHAPKWFNPLKTLEGYEKKDHSATVENIRVECEKAGVEPQEVVSHFAKQYLELRTEYGWVDPVETLKGRPLAVTISQVLNGKNPKRGQKKSKQYAGKQTASYY